MTTILLARHGETDWNREQRWQGVADLPLNARGLEEARTLAGKLDTRPYRAIYTSDLRRAYETALVVAGRRNLSVTPMRDLREIDVGSWTGLSRQEVKTRFPDAYKQWKTRTGRGWEGGETYVELRCRVLDALGAIARNHPSDEVLIVTHSGPIRTVCAHALGLDYATNRRAVPKVIHVEVSAVTIVDGVFSPMNTDIIR